MVTVYLGLGSNLGDRDKNIRNAVRLLENNFVSIKRLSTIIETEPVGFLDQGKFLNAVLKGTTQLSPVDLLLYTQSIEKKLGRTRTIFNGPRTIDIDILLYDHEKISTPQLTIPHPRMWERDFVLAPLKEIEPDFVIRGCLPAGRRLLATKQSNKIASQKAPAMTRNKPAA